MFIPVCVLFQLLAVALHSLEAFQHVRSTPIRRKCTQSMELSGYQSPKTSHERKSELLSKVGVVSRSIFGSLLLRQVANANDVASLPECSDSIIVLKSSSGRDVTLIGTAHISEESAKLVRRTVQTVEPDLVMIELDRKRVDKATDPSTFAANGIELPADQQQAMQADASKPKERVSLFDQVRNAIVGPIVRGAQQAAGAAVGQALSQFYKSVEKLGFTAGGEFMAAAEEGRKIGAKLLLGDRDVDVTLQRLATALSSADSDSFERLSGKLTRIEQDMGLQIPDQLDPGIEKAQLTELVEGLKQKELVNRLMAVIKEELPAVYEALIGERDRYMANSIISSSGKNIVAVVGLAHAAGIERYLTELGGFRSIKRNCPKVQ